MRLITNCRAVPIGLRTSFAHNSKTVPVCEERLSICKVVQEGVKVIEDSLCNSVITCNCNNFTSI